MIRVYLTVSIVIFILGISVQEINADEFDRNIPEQCRNLYTNWEDSSYYDCLEKYCPLRENEGVVDKYYCQEECDLSGKRIMKGCFLSLERGIPGCGCIENYCRSFDDVNSKCVPVKQDA
ncbi:uncharacterized protein LOC123300962 [Chrysoperla carnea]|uniref:uncharacterized protein LOC123300962 n=1 Tax=Chrysoperla carnea TaxID=189513 RepID=UPI001D05E772|nr:uncharacterized protein LOC123300962 [Chrysoperla carnea]